jgi:4-alpha-glucanotransferase
MKLENKDGWRADTLEAMGLHATGCGESRVRGRDLFEALRTELKELPVVAENLGVITTEVELLRKEFGFPGMSLLQFAFGNDPQGP